MLDHSSEFLLVRKTNILVKITNPLAWFTSSGETSIPIYSSANYSELFS
uniref:Uncharacterized protein n=1 Tax=Rhizophora mucronata TaxID=61149 RepID=A0A2P2PGR7_RHIMU